MRTEIATGRQAIANCLFGPETAPDQSLMIDLPDRSEARLLAIMVSEIRGIFLSRTSFSNMKWSSNAMESPGATKSNSTEAPEVLGVRWVHSCHHSCSTKPPKPAPSGAGRGRCEWLLQMRLMRVCGLG